MGAPVGTEHIMPLWKKAQAKSETQNAEDTEWGARRARRQTRRPHALNKIKKDPPSKSEGHPKKKADSEVGPTKKNPTRRDWRRVRSGLAIGASEGRGERAKCRS
jgi:hypothetical protein